MKCCISCFASKYLKEIIPSYSTEKGNCDFCKTLNVNLIDPRSLYYQFKNLIELYVPNSDSSQVKNQDALPIEQRIILDFPSKIFNLTNDNLIKQLLSNIVEGEKELYKDIFDKPVRLKHLTDPGSLGISNELRTSWEKFSSEIKTVNRFHLTNVINLEKMSEILSNITKSYKKGQIFFRSRISDKKGFTKDEMWNPPIINARAGRANPEGISYLYLSDKVDTTVFEIRANLFDYVTIAEFRLKEDISVVNLRDSDQYDPMPFSEAENLEDFLIYLPFISHLENEISRPIRRNDNELDYISTQYLSEFIKYSGYDGVEYKSSLNPLGYNVALFNTDKIECLKTYLEEVTEISYIHSSV